MKKNSNIFWFTGLSGSGKTTVAVQAAKVLEKKGLMTFIVDGDQVRERYHQHLSFTPEDIKENNRLITLICEENKDSYDVIMVPIISPFKVSRSDACSKLAPNFYEIYFSAGLGCVTQRDVKGLYCKAKDREIIDLIGFGGVDYEAPTMPDLIIDSEKETAAESVKKLVDYVMKRTEVVLNES
ncbi:MAG: adenylyl-sulfate kinase [Candidatus Omnitrophica bacterium]|nr:adenylyl-sulfate kinase [Candidatus Omnitrophota bacterium]